MGLPSCNRCYQSMVQTLKAQFCHRCCNWDYNLQSKTRLFDPTDFTHYPKSCSPDNPHVFPSNRTANETHLVPIRQSFENMITAVRVAYYEHTQGTWTNKITVRTYLHSMAIDKVIQERVLESADKYKQGLPVSEDDYLPRTWKLCVEMGFGFDNFVEESLNPSRYDHFVEESLKWSWCDPFIQKCLTSS